MESLIRSLKNDYKVGVEGVASGLSPIYVNSDQFDSWAVERVLKLKPGQKLSNDEVMAKGILARQLTEQLDSQSPGLSLKIAPPDLEFLYTAALTKGPFALKNRELGINVVNMPRNNQIDKEAILKTFGLVTESADGSSFNPKHVKPLPGKSAIWHEMIGQHEGQHINQGTSESSGPTLKTLNNEIDSDRVAIAKMRATGNKEVVDAFIAIRALSAAEGDDDHATGIFLTEGDNTPANEHQLRAAQTFKKDMVAGVAAELSLSAQESEKLRTKDPQKFVQALDEALRHGRIPRPNEIEPAEQNRKIAAEMGLSLIDYFKLGPDRLDDIIKVRDRLRDEGQLHQPADASAPYIKEYSEAYSKAVRTLFVDNTTPEKTAVAEPQKPKEPIVRVNPDIVKLDGLYDATIQVDNIMQEMVAKKLGIDIDKAAELQVGTREEKDQFFQVVENQIKDSANIPQTTTTISQAAQDAIMQDTLRVSEKELQILKEQDRFKYNMAQNRLSNDGAFTEKYENPYLRELMEQRIKENEEDRKQELEGPANESEEEAPENAEPEKEVQPQAPGLSQVSGRYDHLRASPPVENGGKPEIDLKGGDRSTMKVGGLSAGEYFAMRADPGLAADAQPERKVSAPAPKSQAPALS